MVKSEDSSFVKVEKGSPPPEDQTNSYYDCNWVDIQLLETDILHLQACNWPGAPLPPPYFNSPAAGYVSPFNLWASRQVAVLSNLELLSSSPANIHESSSKWSKESYEPAVQVGYWDAEHESEGSTHKELESVDSVNSSSDGNNANTSVEVEELMTIHESIRVENVNLKSELRQLREDLAKARLENAKLMVKLNQKQLTSTGD